MFKLCLLLILIAFKQIAVASDCSKTQKQEILKSKKEVTLNCNLSLNAGDKLSKKLIINESNISLNCNKANISTLYIMSKKSVESFIPPTNVKIENCIINGPVRIIGHSLNGEDKNNFNSSRTNKNHTQYSQSVAPNKIIFDKTVFQASNSIQLYFGPGANNVLVKNSEFKGTSPSTAIYLDAESGYNIFLNNKIGTKTERRELIAIDGSAHNIFEKNIFSNLSNGGIYLYRNCGEGGSVRHQTPSYNIIFENTFLYFQCNELTCSPAIWIASRVAKNYITFYCNDDEGFFPDLNTSSTDDNANAQDNVIMGNTIYNLDHNYMIRNTEYKFNNIIEDNNSLSSE